MRRAWKRLRRRAGCLVMVVIGLFLLWFAVQHLLLPLAWLVWSVMVGDVAIGNLGLYGWLSPLLLGGLGALFGWLGVGALQVAWSERRPPVVVDDLADTSGMT